MTEKYKDRADEFIGVSIDSFYKALGQMEPTETQSVLDENTYSELCGLVEDFGIWFLILNPFHAAVEMSDKDLLDIGFTRKTVEMINSVLMQAAWIENQEEDI